MNTEHQVTTAPPLQAFFSGAGQRVALARERYFELGERPTGMVGEAVIQSWARCRSARQQPGQAIAFDAVTRSRLHSTLERNRVLLDAAQGDLAQLETALAGTGARVLLTDAHGVVVHATAGPASTGDFVLSKAARVGVNLAEACVGTNAPAVVVKTGAPVNVLGGEHYFACMGRLACAAAPIRDGQGHLAGVLDVTVEARPFAFDAAAVVGVYATMIENRLMQGQAAHALVLQFQVSSHMLDTPLEALMGLDARGRVSWHNGRAAQLLGQPALVGEPVEALFGLGLDALLARTASTATQAVRLPGGLAVWLRARLKGPRLTEALTAIEPTPTAPPQSPIQLPTLGAAADDLIVSTLADCQGNLSEAARRLGVSRGLLYRRLQRSSQALRKVSASGCIR